MTQPSLSRRRLLLGGGATLAGGGLAGAAGLSLTPEATVPQEEAKGAQNVPFHGPHQAGIATEAQSHARFLALDLKKGADVEHVRRLLRLLTDDAAKLTAGQMPLASNDPEIVSLPSRLTVTFGFGPGLFDAIGRSADCPEVIRDLPVFATDRLEQRWSGGDVLLQVCSDDPVPLSYAVRRLVRDARDLATVRWMQTGFNPARGSEPAATTPRNLMGQRDGTANPASGTTEFDDTVWAEGPDWLKGGSMLVFRRIRMDVDTWDDLGRPAKEMATARRLSDGSPVTGGSEQDDPDTAAVDGQGLPVVAAEAHVVRATALTPAERMLRRGFSYDDGPDASGKPDCGLLFAAFQSDAAKSFVPVQQRLAESDAMNIWITHVGSAAFVIPPGCAEGAFIGEALVGSA
ncbi:Dyp-type peroxidase [Kineosporia succinea]|uniref:Dye decolorizing peroxidase n=1 Tax=Kineosporia succinea TaxID=84632 RepID=A0ABT9P281_9ACTN|nr:Dyp-type peroxidase [Kineosporia succinea]MDP9826793.1 dye decolorizing peroxidase [Kineosporia succinea]